MLACVRCVVDNLLQKSVVRLSLGLIVVLVICFCRRLGTQAGEQSVIFREDTNGDHMLPEVFVIVLCSLDCVANDTA